ncbi:MAG: SDR family NAD(P)-dependent oxidoreductase [Myxococcales bacterium]|nr:SDR family NAD(P)-dependent oxidoreductase [Myxococcales bacterium]
MSRTLAEAPHVMVTGTSGAIGGGLVRELVARRPDARVTLVDRSEAASRALADDISNARVEVCDLAELDAIPELVARAERELGPIDGLINCAGYMEVRRFDRFAWEDVERLMTVDLLAPLRLFHAVVPTLLERRIGFVVNVTSMAGRVPIRGCAIYGAAKAGLAMASEIAHAELRAQGVHVVTVYPGPVRSALERGARAQFGNTALARAVPTGQALALARRVFDAVESKRARVVYPSLYRVGFDAVGLASRLALSLGPDPVA